jgi:glutamate N-acetyltransferase / amino-acid N-acetyltransferase
MATMLAFIFTVVAIEPQLLKSTLKEAVDKSFNLITVDGDTSTNDMVVVLANGMAKNEVLKNRRRKDYHVFKNNLELMMIHLAQQIVSDGEGASKFIEYEITNAPSQEYARAMIRSISGSVLVKTAMFGRDPNWGRIIGAAGNAGVDFDYNKTDLYLGSDEKIVKVLEKGQPLNYDINFIKKLLRESHLRIKLDLNSGKVKMKGWGTDLTTDYVLFNSVYTT